MKKSMSSFLKRILAVALAMFMVFTSMPLPVVTYATESDTEVNNNKALTIQVTGKTSESDTNAGALTGATVTYTVASSEDEAKEGGMWNELTEDQGNAGIFTLPESSVPTTIDKNVYIKVTHDDYEEQIVEVACSLLAEDREPKTIEMVLLSGVEEKINATVSLTIVDEVTDGVPEEIEVKYIISDLENIPEDEAAWITETCNNSESDTTATISLVDENVIDRRLWVKITGDKYVTESFAIELSELEGDYSKEVRLNQFVNVGISISDSTKAEVVIGDETVSFDENSQSIVIPKSTEENRISYKIKPIDKYYVKSITFGDEDPITFSPGEDIYEGNFLAKTNIDVNIEMGEYYTVSVTEKTEGGSVKLNDKVDSIAVDSNEDVTLKVLATKGYQISEVKIGDKTVSRDQIANPLEYEKVIDTKKDTEISVTFVKVYTVNISYEGKGNVETEPDIVFAEDGGKQVGSVTLDIGTNMSVDISATQDEAEEYRIFDVIVNDESSEEFTIAANKNPNIAEYSIHDLAIDKEYTIEVIFALKKYDITITDNETIVNGTVSIVDEDGVVEHGEDVTVTVAPKDGYTVFAEGITVENADTTTITVNKTDVTVNEDGSCSFVISNITENKSVNVIFSKANSVEEDYSIDSTQVSRLEGNTVFVVNDEGKILFETTKDGIRVYKADQTGSVGLIGGSETEQSVAVAGDTDVVKVQVYYQSENELCFGWHDVVAITEQQPVQVMIDELSASIGEVMTPQASSFGYYNSDVKISITANDATAEEGGKDYSGIASITYFVSNTELLTAAKAENYDAALEEVGVEESVLYSATGNTGIQQQVLKEFTVSITEDNGNNSKDTKVWVKVIDNAGRVTTKIIDLATNITEPTVEVSIDGTKNTDVVGAYYKSERVLKIKITDRADTFLATEQADTLQVAIKKNGQDITLNGSDFTWTSNGNVHEGIYIFSEEGRYEIGQISYKNKADKINEGFSVVDADGQSSSVEAEELSSFVIDKNQPDINAVKIDYPVDKDTSSNDKYYYDDFVNVDITAKDNLSGVRYIRWRYIKTEGASNVNKDTQTDWNVVVCEEEKQVKDKYECTKTIKLPKDGNKQLNGYLEIEIEDWTGHVSRAKAYEDQVFIVDNISPTAEVIYTNPINIVDNVKYYDGDIAFTFKINEANFDAKDVHVFVSKDGAEKVEVVPEWKDETVDLHIGTYTIRGDGDYVVYVNYIDKSGNVMTAYQTEVLTVDTTAPKIDFAYDKSAQKMTFIVTEHNFLAQDISLADSSSITDINGNAIENFSVSQLESMLRSANWSAKGDVHTCTLNSSPDGRYNLTINYTDVASHKADVVPTGEVIIDRTAPTNIKIDYSKSILDTILETITLGFYKGDVTVTFTAYDNISGVDYFTWNYTKQNGASDVNRSTDEVDATVDAVQDTNDKSKFTAKVTLPNTDEKQLRGYLAAYATDTYANVMSTKVTDSGHIIVVDSIAPTMTAEYSAADRIVGTTSYYKDKAEVTFTVTEANFYAEDVVVMVSKDGGTAYAITPKWTDVNADTHVGTYTLSGDGDYVITVDYTDRSTNKMATYVSNVITIDTIQPVVDVVYENKDVINTLTDRDGMNRQYFAKTQTATVTITEHNFNASDVVFNIKATDVTGKELDVNSLYTKSEWKVGDKADTYVCTITYPGDANYTFDVEYADLATNSIADYAPNYFTVDNTAPVDLKVSYSTSILETVLEALSFGFYNAKTDVTITADDAVSGVQAFMYSYTKADGVSAVNAELINQAIAASELVYSADGKTATVHFQIPKDVLTTGNQFNGTISFEATDRAGYKNTLSDSKRIVVDNIAPTASVTYNEPVNREGTISYYDGNVNATVVITEANFYAQDVVVTASIDGGASYAVTPSWVNNSVDTHTGTFTLSEDGDYFITISYRDKSSNEMVVYTSEQLTIDTDIQEPTITFNGNNEDRMAYKGEIIPEISFTDVNYDSFEIFLYRTSMDAIDVDITEEKGINNLFSITDETGSASLNIFDVGEDGKYDPNDDGIYRLLVTMQDKAGHTIEKEAYFTINRYGSVYAFNDYLVNLIADGGAYVNAVNEDLVITEYNADRLVSDSLNIEITRDGKPLDSAEYTVSPTISDGVSVGSSGWYQYEYVISKNNFGIDGIYKVYVSSTDATGNNPENSNFEDKNILFYVDSTVPEITSITGLENAIVDNTELTISYTVFDAIGLKSIKVYVDDEVLQDVTDFSADFNNYSGSFTLEESEKERTIRIVVEDMAGNITDTASEEFTSAYAFNDGVTVTTNALVRFYANKPLFYGSIGGTAGVAGLAGFGIRRFRLRKKIK